MRFSPPPVIHHFLFFSLGGLFGAVIATVIQPGSPQQFLSYLTAYTGFLYLTIALVLGPINLLRGRPVGLSNKLRRNFGIWAGLFAITHVCAGLMVHYAGRWWLYFFQPLSENKLPSIRYDFFGATNYMGLVAAIVFCILLAISNNFSIKNLGPEKWKRIQQLSYPLLLLTFAHGIIYQLLEQRALIFILAMVVGFFVVVIFQVKGTMFRSRIPDKSRVSQSLD